MKKAIIVAVLLLVASLAMAQTYGSWTAREITDPMTDSQDVYFYNREPNGGSIVIWYESGAFLYIAIDFNKYMDNDPVRVALRYDSGEVQNNTFGTSADGTSILTTDYAMLTQLMKSSKFIIRGLNYRGIATLMMFDTTGLAEAISAHIK